MSGLPESPYRGNGQPQLEVLCYAERWSRHEHEPLGPLAEAKARKRHEQGKLYTVVLGDRKTGRPYAFIEVRLEVDFVGVTFLDAQLRDFFDYLFGRPPGEEGPGPLFLEQASYREYIDDESDELATGTVYYFGTDGIVQVEKEDFVKGEVESYKVRDDVSGNWEPVPAFGDYASIVRFERP
jgi:hypothetical protein